jgi:hypothetical protein
MATKIGNIVIGLVLFLGCAYGINYVTHGFLVDFVSNPSMKIPAHVTSRNSLIFITILTIFGISGLFQFLKNLAK